MADAGLTGHHGRQRDLWHQGSNLPSHPAGHALRAAPRCGGGVRGTELVELGAACGHLPERPPVSHRLRSGPPGWALQRQGLRCRRGTETGQTDDRDRREMRQMRAEADETDRVPGLFFWKSPRSLWKYPRQLLPWTSPPRGSSRSRCAWPPINPSLSRFPARGPCVPMFHVLGARGRTWWWLCCRHPGGGGAVLGQEAGAAECHARPGRGGRASSASAPICVPAAPSPPAWGPGTS